MSAYSRQEDNVWISSVDVYRRAREAAEKAIALDQQLADAHRAMGWIQYPSLGRPGCVERAYEDARARRAPFG